MDSNVACSDRQHAISNVIRSTSPFQVWAAEGQVVSTNASLCRHLTVVCWCAKGRTRFLGIKWTLHGHTLFAFAPSLWYRRLESQRLMRDVNVCFLTSFLAALARRGGQLVCRHFCGSSWQQVPAVPRVLWDDSVKVQLGELCISVHSRKASLFIFWLKAFFSSSWVSWVVYSWSS